MLKFEIRLYLIMFRLINPVIGDAVDVVRERMLGSKLLMNELHEKVNMFLCFHPLPNLKCCAKTSPGGIFCSCN